MKIKLAFFVFFVYFISTNAVAQWMSQILYSNYSYQKILFTNDSIGFITGENGSYDGLILRTINRGGYWDSTVFNNGFITIHFPSKETGYIGTKTDYDRLYKTIDGGNIWIPISTTTTYLAAKGLFFIDVDIGYWGGINSPYIFKIINDTINFQNSVTVNSVIDAIYFFNKDTGIVAGWGDGIIAKTTDGGNNWNVVDTNYSLQAIHFPTYSIGYAVGFNGIVVKTTNAGNNWTQQISGTNVNLSSIHCLNDNICYAVGDSGTILKTMDGGQAWEKQNSGTGKNLNSIYCTNTYCYAVGDSGVILKTIAGEVGIKENKKNESEIKVYPNPAKENIRIEIPNGVVIKTIKLCALNGKLIKIFSPKDTLLNIAGIAQGQYLLTIITDKGTFIEKILKQ